MSSKPRALSKERSNILTVRSLALAFPGVEESSAYGQPAFKIRGKLLACIPTHSSAEPGSLVLAMDFNDRAKLLAEATDVVYATEHYIRHPFVLVRLSKVDPEALRSLLGMAHKFVMRNFMEKGRPSTRQDVKSIRALRTQAKF